MKFILIHGAYGNPENHWFPWLKKELSQLGEVIAPKFPTPEGQNLQNWLDVLKEPIDEDTVLIGHSLGVPFILNLLEKNKAKAAFLVAGFVGNLGNPRFDLINSSFADKEFDFETIKNNVSSIFIYHSNNDPYVPLEKAEELAQKLSSDVKLIENAGHFNTDAKYFEFPILLDDIKNL